MDTRFLQTFVSVVELGSIAEAARRLNLTSAAIAQRVQALEAELDAQLIIRVGRNVRPTEAGRAVYERSGSLLQSLQALKAAAALDVPAGELRLGAVSTALTGILPGILKRVKDLYPGLTFYIAPGTSIDLYRRVISGDLDAAILVEPPFAIPKECDWQAIREEPLTLIVPSDMDLSDPHAVLTEQPFVRYDRNHWGGRLADSYLRLCNIKPHERLELDALEAIAIMVNSGLGVSLVPDWAPPWPEGLSLKKWVIYDRRFTRRIGMVWNRSSLQTRVIPAILEGTSGMPREGQNGHTRQASA